MNEVIASENIQENDIFIFTEIGNTSYAFSALSILEIIKLVELEYPEKMPAYVAGILEYRGRIIHIIDLRTILNIETKEYDMNTHILIIQGQDAIYGIIADSIVDIKKIDSTIIAPPPYSAAGTFTKGIYLDNGNNTTVINLEALEEWMKSTNNSETNFNQKAARLLPRDISSKETLHQRKMQLVEKSKGTSYKLLKNKDVYVSFNIKNSTYCLEIAYVGGFYKYSETKIIKVPCTPEFIKGLMSVKGDYITIIDLNRYFDNEPTEITDKSTIIVIESKDFNIGFIVDEISESLNIQTNELFSGKNKGIKSENKNEVIEYVKNDKLYLVLNIKEILNSEKLYIG